MKQDGEELFLLLLLFIFTVIVIVSMTIVVGAISMRRGRIGPVRIRFRGFVVVAVHHDWIDIDDDRLLTEST